MFADLKSVTKFYLGRFEAVLLMAVTILLPILLCHSFVVNTIYLLVVDRATEIAGDFYYSLVSFQTFIFSLSPFILLLKEDYYNGEIRFKKIYVDFFIRAFQLFIFSIIFSIIVAFGVFFFVIPGIVACILMIGIPFTALIQDKNIWKSLRTSYIFGKQNFFKLLVMILLVSGFEIIIDFISQFLVYKVTDLAAAQMLVQMIINMIIFPVLAMWLSKFYLSWLEK
ncbi:hypothetical protein [Bacillus sp. FJAT-49736]|uniref:hypothetical protein n=1 Tax=Bacillus sp. FJAT-49736 TaxID=2833582 RepID=UPI001BC99357|nr:hypothetical protein [Bacillus sp. FJAT-49736]MBS4175852.1 hypothetical protein [Bacillus sp. FJAT-49736]